MQVIDLTKVKLVRDDGIFLDCFVGGRYYYGCCKNGTQEGTSPPDVPAREGREGIP